MTDDLERRLREAAKDRAQMEQETLGAYPRPLRQHIEWQAADEIARLRAENEAAARNVYELQATVGRLVKALEWYANPEVYQPHPHGPAFDRRDLSFLARRALQEGSRHE